MGSTAQIVTAVCSFLTTIAAGYFLLRQAEVKNAFELAQAAAARQEAAALRAEAAAREAAKEVAEVKSTLANSTTRQDAKMDKVLEGNASIKHSVNGALTAVLKVNEEQARRIAKDNPHDEAAGLAAKAAEKLYKDHVAGQAETSASPAGAIPVVIPTVDAPVIVVPKTPEGVRPVTVPEVLPTAGLKVVEAPVTVVSPVTEKGQS